MIIPIILFFLVMLFIILFQGSGKNKKCSHKNAVLRTIYTSMNCETTAEFCQDCGKQLTESKTDCR